jgi:hypothetical protein
LLDGFVEQNIKNWLNFNIIIKQVMIFDLSDLVNSSFLRDVFRSWWFRLEHICLQFHFCLIRLGFTLFR